MTITLALVYTLLHISGKSFLSATQIYQTNTDDARMQQLHTCAVGHFYYHHQQTSSDT